MAQQLNSTKAIQDLQKRVKVLELDVSKLKGVPVTEPVEEPKTAAVTKEAPKEKDSSMEENLGLKWIGYIGALSLICGTVFFLSTPKSDSFGILGRIVVGILASIVFIIAGFLFAKSKQYFVFSRILLGGGFACLYYAVFATYHINEYREALGMNLITNIILLTIVVGIMILQSLKLDSLTIFSESYLLGYFTAMISHEANIYTLVYCLLLSLSLIFILHAKQWAWIGIPAVVMNQIVFLVWYFESFQGYEMFAVLFQLFYLILFIVFARMMTDKHVSNIIDIANSVMFYISLLYVFISWNTFSFEQCGGYVTLGVACIYFLAYSIWRTGYTGRIYLFMTLFYFTLASALHVDNEYIILFWVLEFIVLTLIARINIAIRVFSYFLSLFIVGKLLINDSVLMSDTHIFGISFRMFNILISAASFFYLAVIAKKRQDTEWPGSDLVNIYSVIGASLLFFLILVEYKDQSITLLWGLLSILLIAFGLYLKHRPFRITGLIFLGMTVIKAYLVDIFSLDTATRTVMFVLLGLILLVGSLVYSKFKEKIKEVV